MEMTKVKLCKDCKHHMPEPGSYWNLRCMHPLVNSEDPWALSSGKPHGSSARDERGKKWLGKCGMAGKLWEMDKK
jgi:hypothetical protein